MAKKSWKELKTHPCNRVALHGRRRVKVVGGRRSFSRTPKLTPNRQHRNHNEMPSSSLDSQMPPAPHPTCTTTSALSFELLAKCSVCTIIFTSVSLGSPRSLHHHRAIFLAPSGPTDNAITSQLTQPFNPPNSSSKHTKLAYSIQQLTMKTRQPKQEPQPSTSPTAPSSCRSSCLWLRRLVSRG